MKLYYGNELPDLAGCVVSLGTFDGCHNGHRRVLRRAVAQARTLGVPCVVLTYREHPLKTIAPDKAPSALQDVHQRLLSLQALGVDAVCLRSFTPQEASTEPDVFVKRLVAAMDVRAVVLGRSNAFGKGGHGTPVFLEKEGKRYGFSVEIVDTLRIGGEKITSTAIRNHLEAGRMSAANAMLGYDYALEGDIVRGKQLGRTIGFPTINVELPKDRQFPKFGVYAGWADVAGSSRPCVMNIGIKPTVQGSSPLLEAHLLHYSGNLYDLSANVRIHAFLRPEKKFASVDELQNAIATDVIKAKHIIFGRS